MLLDSENKGRHEILYSVKWRALKVSTPYVYMNDTESAIVIEMKSVFSFLFFLAIDRVFFFATSKARPGFFSSNTNSRKTSAIPSLSKQHDMIW